MLQHVRVRSWRCRTRCLEKRAGHTWVSSRGLVQHTGMLQGSVLILMRAVCLLGSRWEAAGKACPAA